MIKNLFFMLNVKTKFKNFRTVLVKVNKINLFFRFETKIQKLLNLFINIA